MLSVFFDPVKFSCYRNSNFFFLIYVKTAIAWPSAAWPNGLERRFYDDHDRKNDGSTPT